MNVIARVFHAAYNEAVKPKTYVKGDEFQDFLRRVVFPAACYDLVGKTHDYSANRRDFIESSMAPDYRFRDGASGREFYVEAKYRSGFYRRGVDWCQQYQLQRYLEIDMTTPVLIAIGVGGRASLPDHVFLFPVRGVRYTHLFPSFLRHYEIPRVCLSSERSIQLLAEACEEHATPVTA
jgi:hypothetical protein